MTTRKASLLILGASGDLSSRLLMPGLGELLRADPSLDLQLVGAGAEEYSAQEWRDRVAKAFAGPNGDKSVADGDSAGENIARALDATRYLKADVTKADEMKRLIDACDKPPAIYFALPPAVTVRSCEALREFDLPDGLSLALEKPFGTDEASARSLNQLLSSLVPEDRIQRVDHFLGRSTVLNLLGLRFANRVLEPVWNSQHVEKVEIVYDELLALENRARYYDTAGALRDMIQSHLLQVLAVFAMEPPASTRAEDFRDAKAVLLRSTRLWNDDPKTAGRRARYTAGEIDGRSLPSYADEEGVDPAHKTETLTEVTVEVANWRWAGVPFTLRSGKALGEHRREILVTFKPAQHIPEGLKGTALPDRLRISLSPDELSLEINVNGPGDPDCIDRVSLDVAFQPGALPAYGEVLQGIIDADPTLSVRGDTAERCWHIVGPVLAAWDADEVPLDEYPAGSAGPESWSR